MDWFLSLIPGGGLAALGALVVAILGAIGLISRKSTIAERNRMLAKEAEARAKNLQKIQDSIRAGRAAPLDHDSSLSDPNNRDNWK